MPDTPVPPNTSETRVIIVGAGLAGSLLACFMARRGYDVSVYERRPDPRAAGFIGGRSINLALSVRGLNALKQVGLDRAVLDGAVPMPGRMMHSPSGRLTYQAYSKDPNEAINSVSRAGLNLTLINAADESGNVAMHFGQRCVDLDPDTGTVTFQDDASGETTTLEGDLIVGADGAFSAVRRRLQERERFDYSQEWLEHGYKELTIPPAADGGFAMEQHALHIWPRGGYMMIALPNQDCSFTCTCFWPYEGPVSFDAIRSEADVRPFFERHFPDAVPLMPTLADDFMRNPVGSLVTVRCNPWHYRDRVVLVGDSAHAIVPFYGQGINAGFDDCVVLDEIIDECGPDWGTVLARYTARHRVNGDAIADMALHNFIEMRDHVGSPIFLVKKKGERLLHTLIPGMYTPLYNLVTFSRVPYAEALQRAGRQSAIVQGFVGAAAAVLLFFIIWLIYDLISR